MGMNWEMLPLLCVLSVNLTIAKEVIVQINPKRLIHYVPERFLSMSIDPETILKAALLDQGSRNMARGLSPSYVRLGGKATNYMKFGKELTMDSNTFIEQWDSLNRYAKEAGLDLIACLNPTDRIQGVWDSRNALEIISYSDKQGYNLTWQLGYDTKEWKRSGAEMGRDVVRLRKILDGFHRYTRTPLLGPDITGPNDGSFLKEFLEQVGSIISAIVLQPSFKNNEDPGRTITNMLTEIEHQIWGKEITLNHMIPRRPVWIADKEPSQGGVSDAFSLIKRLGSAAKIGCQLVLRQPGPDALKSPTPEYWVALLYKNIIGRGVFDLRITSGNKTELHLYSHCIANLLQSRLVLHSPLTYNKGEVIVFGVNELPENINLSIRTSMRNELIHAYILTFVETQTGEMGDTFMNGQLLKLSINGELPELSPNIRRVNITGLNIPARSVFFLVLPEVKSRVCTSDHIEVEQLPKKTINVATDVLHKPISFTENRIKISKEENESHGKLKKEELKTNDFRVLKAIQYPSVKDSNINLQIKDASTDSSRLNRLPEILESEIEQEEVTDETDSGFYISLTPATYSENEFEPEDKIQRKRSLQIQETSNSTEILASNEFNELEFIHRLNKLSEEAFLTDDSEQLSKKLLELWNICKRVRVQFKPMKSECNSIKPPLTFTTSTDGSLFDNETTKQDSLKQNTVGNDGKLESVVSGNPEPEARDLEYDIFQNSTDFQNELNGQKHKLVKEEKEIIFHSSSVNGINLQDTKQNTERSALPEQGISESFLWGEIKSPSQPYKYVDTQSELGNKRNINDTDNTTEFEENGRINFLQNRLNIPGRTVEVAKELPEYEENSLIQNKLLTSIPRPNPTFSTLYSSTVPLNMFTENHFETNPLDLEESGMKDNFKRMTHFSPIESNENLILLNQSKREEKNIGSMRGNRILNMELSNIGNYKSAKKEIIPELPKNPFSGFKGTTNEASIQNPVSGTSQLPAGKNEGEYNSLPLENINDQKVTCINPSNESDQFRNIIPKELDSKVAQNIKAVKNEQRNNPDLISEERRILENNITERDVKEEVFSDPSFIPQKESDVKRSSEIPVFNSEGHLLHGTKTNNIRKYPSERPLDLNFPVQHEKNYRVLCPKEIKKSSAKPYDNIPKAIASTLKSIPLSAKTRNMDNNLDINEASENMNSLMKESKVSESNSKNNKSKTRTKIPNNESLEQDFLPNIRLSETIPPKTIRNIAEEEKRIKSQIKKKEIGVTFKQGQDELKQLIMNMHKGSSRTRVPLLFPNLNPDRLYRPRRLSYFPEVGLSNQEKYDHVTEMYTNRDSYGQPLPEACQELPDLPLSSKNEDNSHFLVPIDPKTTQAIVFDNKIIPARLFGFMSLENNPKEHEVISLKEHPEDEFYEKYFGRIIPFPFSKENCIHPTKLGRDYSSDITAPPAETEIKSKFLPIVVLSPNTNSLRRKRSINENNNVNQLEPMEQNQNQITGKKIKEIQRKKRSLYYNEIDSQSNPLYSYINEIPNEEYLNDAINPIVINDISSVNSGKYKTSIPKESIRNNEVNTYLKYSRPMINSNDIIWSNNIANDKVPRTFIPPESVRVQPEFNQESVNEERPEDPSSLLLNLLQSKFISLFNMLQGLTEWCNYNKKEA